MFKLWLSITTNPDSDFSDDYSAKIHNYIVSYRKTHRDSFIFLRETFEEDYMELDIYELWFESRDQALTFKLASPCSGNFTDEPPEYEGLQPYSYSFT